MIVAVHHPAGSNRSASSLPLPRNMSSMTSTPDLSIFDFYLELQMHGAGFGLLGSAEALTTGLKLQQHPGQALSAPGYSHE